MPANAKPATATGTDGAVAATRTPAAATSAPARRCVTVPSRCVMRSPKRRPTVIVAENATRPATAVPSEAASDSARWIALQSVTAPSASSAQNAIAPRPASALDGRAKRGPAAEASAPAGSSARPTESVTSAQRIATPGRCVCGDAPARRRRPQRARRPARRGRRPRAGRTGSACGSRRSTATPCMFIATSRTPAVSPTAAVRRTSAPNDPAKPAPRSPRRASARPR